jgi:hypothetical protein
MDVTALAPPPAQLRRQRGRQRIVVNFRGLRDEFAATSGRIRGCLPFDLIEYFSFICQFRPR